MRPGNVFKKIMEESLFSNKNESKARQEQKTSADLNRGQRRKPMDARFLSRGKRVDNGEWVQGYYLRYPEHASDHHEMRWHNVDTEHMEAAKIDPATLGHCTGLVDTCDKSLQRRLAQLAVSNRDIHMVREDEHGQTYTFPKKWVKIKPPRQLSSEKRAELAERARRNLHGK